MNYVFSLNFNELQTMYLFLTLMEVLEAMCLLSIYIKLRTTYYFSLTSPSTLNTKQVQQVIASASQSKNEILPMIGGSQEWPYCIS